MSSVTDDTNIYISGLHFVTGDKKHILPLGSHAGIPIVKVAEFLRQLSS